jgi:hypothetical protein
MPEWIDTTQRPKQPTYRDLKLPLTDGAAITTTTSFARVWLRVSAQFGGPVPDEICQGDTRRLLEALIPRTQEALARMTAMLEEIIRGDVHDG